MHQYFFFVEGQLPFFSHCLAPFRPADIVVECQYDKQRRAYVGTCHVCDTSHSMLLFSFWSLKTWMLFKECGQDGVVMRPVMVCDSATTVCPKALTTYIS
jgi:hypothetical protein